MKTDKFEKTIRRKLESITPEFHEDDWTKMQDYMHAHTPPTFWQQYSSWLGYAAAATVTTVMAFLYINQLSQNNVLLTDVKTLKNQIEVIKNTPAVIQKTDTVYIVQRPQSGKNQDDQQYIVDQRYAPQQRNNEGSLATTEAPEAESEIIIKPSNLKSDQNPEITANHATPEFNRKGLSLANNERSAAGAEQESISGSDFKSPKNIENGYKPDHLGESSADVMNNINRTRSENGIGNSGKGNWAAGSNDGLTNKGTTGRVVFTKTLGAGFDDLKIKSPVQENNIQALSRRMNYGLAKRIAPARVKSALLASNTSGAKLPASEKNVAAAKKTATTIPRLNLKVPYRFGFAQQWEGKNQVKTVVAEVIVARRFSISTGLSWLKIKQKDFYSEKSYREKTKKNFREDYKPHLMPFEGIENINIKPSVIQIPLTVAYRNDLKNDFAFFVGAGTNFTVKQKQDVGFDCYRDFYNPMKPTIIRAVRREEVTEKMNLNLVNSVNFSAGIEKSWHPVVLQAEGYLYTYFSPLAPQSSKSGPGFKIKLLYQIGKKL